MTEATLTSAPATRGDTTYCENCGNRIFKKYAFCTGCGTATDMAMPAPAVATPAPYRPARFGRLKLAALATMVVGLIALPTLYGEVSLATASPVMRTMADDAGLSHKGEVILMSAHPTLTSNIQSDCATGESQASGFVEQGCFVPLSHKIFVREMPPELADMQLVTVSHEMLHVAYGRLSDSEKRHVNAMLEAEVAGHNLPGLKEKLDYYQQAEPGQRDNELHSLLATEYTDLSPDLEQYYAQYFDDRSVVTTANAHVANQFSTMLDQINGLQAQMADANKTADSYYASHVQAAANGDAYYTNYYYGLYTRALADYNAKLAQYNSVVKQYNSLAEQYNGQKF